MRIPLCFMVALYGLTCPVAAETFRGGRCVIPRIGLAQATVSALTATPGTISFSASNPNSGVAAGSSTASLNWTLQGGLNLQTWTVSVQATAGNFSGCSTVPVSAVTVSCTGASVGGGAGTGTCRGPFTLSTVAQPVASGAQGLLTQAYSVQINYTLADSWRYVANSACTLSLTYTVNAP
jgi:hypothetical protein